MTLFLKDYSDEEWEQISGDNGGFETTEQKQEVENDLIAVAIFALSDPLRPNIAKTVDLLHSAGINIRMVTGD